MKGNDSERGVSRRTVRRGTSPGLATRPRNDEMSSENLSFLHLVGGEIGGPFSNQGEM